MTSDTLTKFFRNPLCIGLASAGRVVGCQYERDCGSAVSPLVPQRIAMRAFLVCHSVLIQNAISMRQTGMRN